MSVSGSESSSVTPLLCNHNLFLTGISGEKVEIDPKGGKRLIFKQRAVSYPMEDIVECMMLEEKSSGKTYCETNIVANVRSIVIPNPMYINNLVTR